MPKDVKFFETLCIIPKKLSKNVNLPWFVSYALLKQKRNQKHQTKCDEKILIRGDLYKTFIKLLVLMVKV